MNPLQAQSGHATATHQCLLFLAGKDGVIGGRFCGLAEDFGCRASPW
jgi:hypothetical protein